MNVKPLITLMLVLAAPAWASDLSPRSDLGRSDLPAAAAVASPLTQSQGSSITATQRGNRNQATVVIQGPANDIVLTQQGNHNQASIAATGSNSRIAVGQHGNAHTVDIQVIGDNRVIEIQQTGNRRSDKVILH